MRWAGAAARSDFRPASPDKRAPKWSNVAGQTAANALPLRHRRRGDPVRSAAWYLLARQAGLFDPEMEDLLYGLDDDQIAEARERAGTLR